MFRRIVISSLALLLACLVSACDLAAQEKKYLDPRSLGFELAPGEVLPGGNDRVTTADDAGRAVVARVHVRVGNQAIVLLPDGSLVARKAEQMEATQRPFVPISKDELADRLLSEGPLKSFNVHKTKNYLFLYTTSEKFAFGTSRILESMLPGVRRYLDAQKIATRDPELPLVVIMFRTEADFQAYRRMPPGVVAYYHTLTNQVCLYEQSALLQTRPDLAIQQAISTIAHEGTHQILHNTGVQQRLSVWPMWISEGMAEFLAPTTFGNKLTWKGAAQVNDLRMFELEQYVQSKGAEEPKGDTIKHTVLAGRLTSTGYATAWSLTHYLATKRKADFAGYLAEISSLGPLEGSVDIKPPGVVPDNLTAFEKAFGSEYLDLERKLVQHLKKLPYTDPFAGQPHYAALLISGEGKSLKREARTFHTPTLASKWLGEMQEKRTAAQPSIREFSKRAEAEEFVRLWLQGR